MYLLHLGNILNGTAYCDTQLDCIFALQEGFSLVDIDERFVPMQNDFCQCKIRFLPMHNYFCQGKNRILPRQK